MALEHLGGARRDGDRADAGGRLGRTAEPLAVDAQQLLGDADLAAGEIDLAAAEADELAPAHPGVEGEVDHRLEVLRVGFGEGDALRPREDRHRPGRDPRRADLGARVGEQAVLLDRRLQDAAQRAVVAVHRRRRDAAGELGAEPLLDLLGVEARQAAVAEGRQDVQVEVPAVGLRATSAPATATTPGTPRTTPRSEIADLRGSIQAPRSMSTSTSRAKRSASALRTNVRLRLTADGSRKRTRYLPLRFSIDANATPLGTHLGHIRTQIGHELAVNAGHQRSLAVKRKQPLSR